MRERSFDKLFFSICIALTVIGVVMFTSASLGILAKNETKFYGVLFNQFAFGLLGGGVVMYFGMKINYKKWREWSLPIFIATILLSALVFIPHVGFSHGGARRWINVFGVSLQPVEFLKVAFVIYFSAWLSWVKGKVRKWQWSILPLIIFLGVIAIVLLKQPDTKSVILISITALTMLFISGMPWKRILAIFAIAIIGFAILVSFKPYLRDRVATFLNPANDPSGSSYQLQQSLIAIGSGGLFGRGLGQSIQKFNYLPEPQGDSIFAVIGEEMGFIGCIVLIAIFVAFALRGYKIGMHAPDPFSKLFVIGMITMLTAQAFMNIASITGVFPLTGVPLVFISHGGTSLMITLFVIGIILNISKFEKKGI